MKNFIGKIELLKQNKKKSNPDVGTDGLISKLNIHKKHYISLGTKLWNQLKLVYTTK